MRRKAQQARVPHALAVYDAADWDGPLTAEESSHYRDGEPPTAERWELLRRWRWQQARVDWAEEHAPAAWPDLFMELLRLPV